MKRIAILALSRHISSLGGIGFYIDSFIHASKNRYIVDLIVDRPIKKSDIPFKHIAECDIICSKLSVPYASSNFFMFYGEKSFYELGINTINSLTTALESRIYDCLFVNSHEMGVHLAHAGFDKIVPTVAYTHHNIFYRGYPESIDECGAINLGLIKLPHITQAPNHELPEMNAPHRRFSYLDTVFHVPMVNSEYEFFKSVEAKPEAGTVLFNGTYRDIKRPGDFLEFCKYHKKKGLIITNAKGKVFFEEEFKKAGLECEVKTSIFGKEKVEFISRAEMMFHPAKNEMMSLAVLEALFFMPVIVYQENWVDMCPDGFLTIIDDIKNFDVSMIKDLDRRAWVMNYFEPTKNMNAFDGIIDHIGSLIPSTTTSSSLDAVKQIIKEKGGLSVESYWKEVKNRNSIILADISTFYKISKNVKVTQTLHASFFGSEVLPEEDSLLDLF